MAEIRFQPFFYQASEQLQDMFEILSSKTYLLLFVVAIIVTLVLTLGVPVGLAKTGLINDKIAHATIFFVLAFLYSHTIGNNYNMKAVTLLIIFGLMIETIQYLIPWRSFSWFDWLADIIGIAGYELIHRIKKIWFMKSA